MSTFAFQATESPAATEDFAADDFTALEQRILRAVDLLKTERAARTVAEAKVAELHESLENQTADLLRAEAEIETYKTEREVVKGRVERLLGQLDEISF